MNNDQQHQIQIMISRHFRFFNFRSSLKILPIPKSKSIFVTFFIQRVQTHWFEEEKKTHKYLPFNPFNFLVSVFVEAEKTKKKHNLIFTWHAYDYNREINCGFGRAEIEHKLNPFLRLSFKMFSENHFSDRF